MTEGGLAANFSIQNLTFTGGYTTGQGGALSINSPGGELTISNSTLYGNYAAQGSSVYASAQFNVSITNTTFNGDTGPGGSVNIDESANPDIYSASLTSTTISGNASGLSYTPSIIGADGGFFTIAASIIAGNGTGNGCSRCNLGSTDYTGANPMLGPLQYNGSLLMTMLPQPGSPVIGIAGQTSGDERGFPGKTAGDAGAVQTNYVAVNTLADSATDTSSGICGQISGPCSLREAINLGNSNATGTDITFDPALTANTTQTVNGVTTYTPVTIPLAVQLPDITGAIDIAGPGANVLQVSGMNQYDIINVPAGGNLAFNGLTATASGLPREFNNSCTLDNNGLLTLANMQVTAANDISVCNAHNVGSSTAALVLADSTVSGGSGQFGVVLVAPSQVLNSTISGNATSNGAVEVINYPTLFAGTTISNNTSNAAGQSALETAETPGLVIANSIVEGNASAAGPQDAADAVYTDGGGNLINRSENYVNPSLAPLAYNGGTTRTMLPLPGSPAICTGLTSNQDIYGLPADQRGATHSSAYCTASGNVDAGAVQTSYSALAFLQQPTNTVVNAAITPAPSLTVTENGIDAGGVPVTLTLASGEGTLAGTAAETTVLQGAATFPGLSINQPGTGDTLSSFLTITPTGYAGTNVELTTTSNPFNITSGVTQLAFGTPPPATLAAGGNAGTITVQEENASGSVVPSASDTISLNVTGPGYSANYTAPAVNGVATFNLSGVPLTSAGRYSYNASVTGLSPAAAKETVTVGPASMVAVVSGSGQSAVLNTAFANPLKVQVTDAYGNLVGAGTTVNFAAPASGASAGLSSSTATTAGSSSTASITATANGAAGTYSVTASVAGGTSAASFSLTNTMGTPAVMVASQSIAYGTASTTLTATVAYSGVAPTGAVIFQVDSGALVTATCTGSVSPLSCSATYSTGTLSASSHTITASLAADANYSGASDTGTLTVLTAAPTITFNVAPSYAYGQSLQLSATSNSPGAFTYSLISGPATVTPSGSVTVTGEGTVVVQASQAAAGSYTSGSKQASFAATKASTTTALTATAVKSGTGTAATLNAMVAPQFSGTPTGSVTFYDGGTQLATVPLSSGTATYTTPQLVGTSHSFSAAYMGDSNFNTSPSNTVVLTIPVASTPVTLQLLSTQLVYPAPPAFAIRVGTGALPAPTGTVKIYDGSTVLATYPLYAITQGYLLGLVLPPLNVGTHMLQAVYSGDANHAPGQSPVVQVTVTPGPVKLTLQCANTQLKFGQTLNCTVSAKEGPLPVTGTITYTVTNWGQGSVTLNKAGQAAIAFQPTARGSFTITATYAAQGNYQAAPPASVGFTVN